MITLLSPHFEPQELTEHDLIIASIAWGFTIGFGWLTTWTAIKQSAHVYRRCGRAVFRNTYIWMIWLEILVCLIFAIVCFLHLRFIIPPRSVLRLLVGCNNPIIRAKLSKLQFYVLFHHRYAPFRHAAVGCDANFRFRQ